MELLLSFSARCTKPFPVLCRWVSECPCGPVLGSGVARNPWEHGSCFLMTPACQAAVVLPCVAAGPDSSDEESVVLQQLACRSRREVAEVAASLSAAGASEEK